METNLSNIATVLGNYNFIPTQITSEALVVSMISGLTVRKLLIKWFGEMVNLLTQLKLIIKLM